MISLASFSTSRPQGTPVSSQKWQPTRFKSALISCTALALLIGSAIPLSAQEAAAETEAESEASNIVLMPIIVRDALAFSGAIEGYLAPATETGLKAGVPLNEVPQSISVVTSTELEVRQPTQVEDAIKYSAGINPSTWGTDDRFDQFSIRGFDMGSSSLYRDGLPQKVLNFAAFTTDPYMLERIDVMRGPAGTLYGSNDAGGMVNLVTKRPVFDQKAEAHVGYDSNGTAEVGFDWSDAVNQSETVAARITALWRDGETEVEKSENDRAFVAGGVTFAPTDFTSLTVLGHFQKDARTPIIFSPVPGEDFSASFGTLPKDYNLKQSPYNLFETEQQSIGWDFKHDFDNGIKINQRLRFAHQKTDYQQLDYSSTDATGLKYYAFKNDEDAESLGFDNNIEWQSNWDYLTNNLTVGFDYQRSKYDVTQFLDYTLYTVPFSNPSLDFAVADPALSSRTSTTYTEKGIYAQNHLKFDNGTSLTLGLRRSWLNNKIKNLIANSASSQEDQATTGMIGITHEFDNGFTPYASYTEGFVQNVGKTLAGKALDPSQSKQWEVGFRYELIEEQMMLSAALFDLRKTKVKDYDLNDPTWSSFTQAGEIRSRGLELEARGRIHKRIQAVFGYTYLDTEITKSTDPAKLGKENAMAPHHQVSAWVDYDASDFVKGLHIGAGVRYNSEAFSTQNNLRKTPGYATVDLSARYENDLFNLKLGVTNLLDKTYSGICYDNYGCSKGEGRKASLTLSKEF